MSKVAVQDTRRLILIPSYNTGCKLLETVREALQFWQPVWVIIDGSNDGSAEELLSSAPSLPGLHVMRFAENRGKGAAVLGGLVAARNAGYEYALVMDADGQHPADRIPQFMELSQENPSAMILGVPDFGSEAPASRKYGRRVGNWWANAETLWGGVCDSLFGFRIYPINASVDILQNISGGRGYDFDTELAVRLYWTGVRPINVRIPVRYFAPNAGGVSHFNYLRDNFLLIKTHIRLVVGTLLRLRLLWNLRRRV